MGVKIILKIRPKQEQDQDFQSLQDRHLKGQKIGMMYTEVKIARKKNCESLKEHTMEIISFRNRK